MNKKRNRILLLTASFFAILAGIICFHSFQEGSSPTASEPASAPARTTKSFTSTERASQGTPSSRNAHAKTTDHRVIPIPREESRRLLESDPNPIILTKEDALFEKPTWSKDSLTLLGLDDGQQAQLQEVLDQATTRAFEVMKRKVKLVNEDKKTGKKTFEIPDWSKEEGIALRAEMTKSLENVVSADDAAFLMKLLYEVRKDESFSLNSDETRTSLFGVGTRKISISEASGGQWRINDNVQGEVIDVRAMIDSGRTSFQSPGYGRSYSTGELSKEWQDIFNLSAEYCDERKREWEKARSEVESNLEEFRKQLEAAEAAAGE
jgi:hypothetical protein